MSDDYQSGGDNARKEVPLEPQPHGATESAALDSVFQALSDRRRRYVLYYLTQVERDVVERADLVVAIRRIEAATPGSGEPAPADRVAADLHHNHLPRLAEAGFLDYDRRQGTVRYTETPALEEWVDHARHREELCRCSNDS